jgi:hypothetical protein
MPNDPLHRLLASQAVQRGVSVRLGQAGLLGQFVGGRPRMAEEGDAGMGLVLGEAEQLQIGDQLTTLTVKGCAHWVAPNRL